MTTTELPVAAATTPSPAPPPGTGDDVVPRTGPRVPLRVTLVALLVALVTVALCATALASTSLLRDYLLEQQDQQLNTTLDALQQQPNNVTRNCVSEPPLFPNNTYAACIDLTEDVDDVTVLQGPVRPSAMPDISTIDTTEPRLLHTLRGVGYSLRLPRGS